ncbi:hypothetical protein QWY77_04800 [Thalassotalea ponticola]|uniref:hypothetical protein n=1 Tax=Thalassotalea ponticola TaxID=1523392 RepID=UPI0025B2ECBB|nr:hypothetical protein [Thalassotalea ponticola]MDN3652085.1 hypothetical protein [Thalassotalea ponticola]
MSGIDLSQLTSVSKLTAKSFHDQKALIKKVLLGRRVHCKKCRQLIAFTEKNHNHPAKICCPKGCTDIELDIG